MLLWVAAAVAVLVLLAAGAAIASRSLDEGTAVEFKTGGEVYLESSIGSAMKRASALAGFEVHRPRYIHDPRLGLVTIEVDAEPAAGPEVTLFYFRFDEFGNRRGLLAIRQVNYRAEHPARWSATDDPNRKIESGVPGWEAWFAPDAIRSTYTVFAGERTYYLTIDDPQPSPAQLGRMLQSLKP